MPRLFVYGTLKRGGANHGQLLGARFISEARTEPFYRLFMIEDYPGLVEVHEDGRCVEGELWEVDPALVDRLDAFEGTSEGLFHRGPVRLAAEEAGAVEAYFYQRSTAGKEPILRAKF